MRLVVARCEVDYTGRLAAHLPLALRLVMVKADGCVAVHSDEGAYKPLNWMNAPNHLEESAGEWVVTNGAGERAGPLRAPGDGDDRRRLHRAHRAGTAHEVCRGAEPADRAADGGLGRVGLVSLGQTLVSAVTRDGE